jgi:hypothetical protein
LSNNSPTLPHLVPRKSKKEPFILQKTTNPLGQVLNTSPKQQQAGQQKSNQGADCLLGWAAELAAGFYLLG